uniref:Lipase_3 domain-containing protein n=1 Tax=Panagrellus redivivus TaxID=6233 RepID=A0A7E4ZU72_PANRE
MQTYSANSSIKSARATAASAKKGNVFVLLNTLYAAGIGSVDPINPMLTGRTMHTLYAVSFLVYLSNSLVDWIHVYYILGGHVTSFPLAPWFSVGLVCCAVVGSMLNGLLMALCMENAFVQRINVSPYRNGLAVVIEAFFEWVQSFNNFRVAFLVMLLRDCPWTIINYFILTSCRWPQLSWHITLILSSIMTIISIGWRIIMLYFSYRRFLFGDKQSRRKSSRPTKQWPRIMDHVKMAINTSDGGRLDEYDEAWPVRYAISKIYGLNYQRMTTEIYLEYEKKAVSERISEILSILIYRSLGALKFVVKRMTCALLALIVYIGMVAIGCIPCLWFYFCRSDSLNHRHKCSKSFVRVCSLFYHYVIIGFSVVICTILLTGNVILLSSMHVHSHWNTLPPNLNYLCLEFDTAQHRVQPVLSSDPHLEVYGSSENTTIVCKALWDKSLKRRKDSALMSPWQERLKLNKDQMLVVSVFLYGNLSNTQEPYYNLYYDYGVLQIKGNKLACSSQHHGPFWRFEESFQRPSLPYFLGCLPFIAIYRYNGISCT